MKIEDVLNPKSLWRYHGENEKKDRMRMRKTSCNARKRRNLVVVQKLQARSPISDHDYQGRSPRPGKNGIKQTPMSQEPGIQLFCCVSGSFTFLSSIERRRNADEEKEIEIYGIHQKSNQRRREGMRR